MAATLQVGVKCNVTRGKNINICPLYLKEEHIQYKLLCHCAMS